MTKTVLIVEDNILNMKLFNDILRANGWETICARTGEEGIQAMREHHPPIVILDIHLPDMSGVEVLKRVRQSPWYRPRVVILTAFAMKGDKERFFEAGCDAYLAKPVSVGQFIGEADRQLALSST